MKVTKYPRVVPGKADLFTVFHEDEAFMYQVLHVLLPVRGFAKNLFSKTPSLLWKWVGGSRSRSDFFLENHPKIALNQY